MPGKLTVAPTPIGNMEDVTPRVRRTLAEADVVACEDTRRAGRLFERLEIETPRLVSNHEGNEDERAIQLAQAIERGAKVALVTDAGTPAISDPGWRLIRTCIDRDLEVEVLPGPSAVTTALVASGLPAHRWRFEGFLPRRAGELERVLQATETVVAFESPRRLPESLAALAQLAPDRPAAVCRELSKLHEEVARGTLSELARRFREDVRGEIVLVLGAGAGAGGQGAAGEDMQFAVDALRRLVQSGARPRAAAQVVAALTGTRPNELYTALTGRAPRE
ncbi:MAG TPA: 16S rRNA (cytidine(1402)-2'-O)-methyltransferase [Solirubrobacterales bacterium]